MGDYIDVIDAIRKELDKFFGVEDPDEMDLDDVLGAYEEAKSALCVIKGLVGDLPGKDGGGNA